MDSIWYEILVIVLSVTLIVFFVLSIILTILSIKIAKTIKRITDHAEQIADNAEHVSDFFRTAAPPLAIMKLITNLGENIYKKTSKKGK